MDGLLLGHFGSRSDTVRCPTPIWITAKYIFFCRVYIAMSNLILLGQKVPFKLNIRVLSVQVSCVNFHEDKLWWTLVRTKWRTHCDGHKMTDTLWWTQNDGHIVMDTKWRTHCDGHKMTDTLWWTQNDGHTVTDTLWPTHCYGHTGGHIVTVEVWRTHCDRWIVATIFTLTCNISLSS